MQAGDQVESLKWAELQDTLLNPLHILAPVTLFRTLPGAPAGMRMSNMAMRCTTRGPRVGGQERKQRSLCFYAAYLSLLSTRSLSGRAQSQSGTALHHMAPPTAISCLTEAGGSMRESDFCSIKAHASEPS